MNDFPDKGWSFSRDNSFKNCKFKYYCDVFGYNKGWFKSSPCENQEIYKYKKIKNIHFIKGEEIHNEINDVINEIKSGKCALLKTPNDIKVAVNNKLRQACRSSKRNLENGNFEINPKDYIMLQEYYFFDESTQKVPISSELADKIKEDIDLCATNFFETETFDNISTSSNIEIIENEKNIDFKNCVEINGYKLFFKLDLLYKDDDGTYWVVDWKTGEFNKKDKEQVMFYIYYAINKYPNIKIGNIKGKIEYLITNTSNIIEFNKEDYWEIDRIIKESISNMEEYLDDKDLNKPKAEKFFPKNINSPHCNYCNFRLKCKDKGDDIV